MCEHSISSKKGSSSVHAFTSNTVSIRSLLCTLLTLLTSLNVMVVEARPKTSLTESLDKNSLDPLLPNGESPNLRKILYPTYFSRDPFEMEKWEFYGNKAYLLNPNPMSRYSDLFDRDLRSPVDYVVVEQQDDGFMPDRQVEFESGEAPEFMFGKPGFLPFYSGRIGRR